MVTRAWIAVALGALVVAAGCNTILGIETHSEQVSDAGAQGPPDASADGAALECAPGTTQCAGNGVETCDDAGVWSTPSKCPFICSGGACGGACLPGQAQCADGGVQTCNDAGAWGSPSSCPFACSGGACSGTCTVGATRCNGNELQTCNAMSSWQDTMACPAICLNGACAACTPGSTQCSGSAVQTCNSAGQWATTSTCPNCCSGSGMCTGVCAPGATQCMAGALNTCTGSCTWQAGSVVPGQCGAVCSPGQSGCGGKLSCGTPSSTLPCQAGWYYAWTAPGVVYQGVCDSTGQWAKNYCTGTCYDTAVAAQTYFCNCTPSTGVCVSGGTCP